LHGLAEHERTCGSRVSAHGNRTYFGIESSVAWMFDFIIVGSRNYYCWFSWPSKKGFYNARIYLDFPLFMRFHAWLSGGGYVGRFDRWPWRLLSSILSSFLSPSVPSNFVNGQVLSTNLYSNIVAAALFNLMAETSFERLTSCGP